MRRPPHVLVLGGTSEANELVPLLLRLEPRPHVVTSFAGRTRTPRLPEGGRARIGGFGGTEGLARYLRDRGVDLVVDATHPFAAQMSANAEQACSSTSVPRVRLQRPAWIEQDGDRWHRVPDLDAAAGALADLGARRVLLTTGRQELQPFAGLTSTWFLVRAVDAPDPQPLPDAEVLLDRGPFTFDAELGLLRDYGIDALLTKDSGGAATAPKMEAARTLAIPVIVVDRPSPPPGPLVTDAAAAATWAADTLRHLQAD